LVLRIEPTSPPLALGKPLPDQAVPSKLALRATGEPA
jgi:hypothetical protein